MDMWSEQNTNGYALQAKLIKKKATKKNMVWWNKGGIREKRYRGRIEPGRNKMKENFRKRKGTSDARNLKWNEKIIYSGYKINNSGKENNFKTVQMLKKKEKKHTL